MFAAWQVHKNEVLPRAARCNVTSDVVLAVRSHRRC